jgi:pyruvate/2-oxoglutarate dehydrogenase complex dihydrolipoamide acyltransferase (E2) component
MTGDRIEIRIDDPGDFEEVEVVEVSVEEGATVAEGDLLLEVATDKANLEIFAPRAGTVAQVLVEEGATIPVDQVLVVLEP